MDSALLRRSSPRTRVGFATRTNTRVLVVGELNVDIVAAGLLRPPRLGYEIEATSFDIVLGSASAIFACGVARLGHAVSFVAKVGRDAFGARCVRELRRRGIDTSAVLVDDRLRTGATLVMSTKRDRAMVTYAGAMAELSEREVPRSAFASAAHLHLTSYGLQRALRPGFAKLLERAKRAGMTTSLDPNSNLSGRSRHEFMALLPWVDVLLLNALEARQLTGLSSPRSALERLARRAPIVVVKLGARGGFARTFEARARSEAARGRCGRHHRRGRQLCGRVRFGLSSRARTEAVPRKRQRLRRAFDTRPRRHRRASQRP